MNNLQLLAHALSYMEEHMSESLRTEDIAAGCYCSKSSLEKLFRNVNNISVHDYIVRRKMVIAAKELQAGSANILELALSLGYNSNEAFTRAFRRVWNCNPSEYSTKYRFSGLYPRLSSTPLEGEFSMKKNVDISELYDLFTRRRSCCFVCCDIKGLIPINDISRKAGDLAIIESMKRISEAAGENDLVFRIGGDEFVLLTDSADTAYAESIAKKISDKNGIGFDFDGHMIPLDLHVSVTKCEEPVIKYNELFAKLHSSIDHNK